jgi:beta-glucosidase
LLGKSCKTASEAKQAGTTFSFYRANEEGNRVGEAFASTDALDSEAKILDGIPHGLSHPFAGLLRGTYTADHTGDVEFGLIVAGRGKLYLDDTLVVDNWTKQRPGTGYYGQGTLEEKGAFKLEEGREYNLRVEFSSMYADQKIVPAGWAVRVGSFPVIDEAEEIAKAVKLAAAVEVPIVVVGLNHEWESEGFDRTELGLPLKMNELVAAVAKANSNTVVVVQSVRLMWSVRLNSF